MKISFQPIWGIITFHSQNEMLRLVKYGKTLTLRRLMRRLSIQMLQLNRVVFYFSRSSKISPSSNHPMFSTSWLGFPAHVNQGLRGQNCKLGLHLFFCKVFAERNKRRLAAATSTWTQARKNRMHRKLIGSILYKQSCTAQKLAIKRAKLKHVFNTCLKGQYTLYFSMMT